MGQIFKTITACALAGALYSAASQRDILIATWAIIVMICALLALGIYWLVSDVIESVRKKESGEQ